MKKIKWSILIVLLFIVLIILYIQIGNSTKESEVATHVIPPIPVETTPIIELNADITPNVKPEIIIEDKNPKIELVFGIFEIDSELEDFMTGKSYYKNDNVNMDDLRLVKVIYMGYDELPHQGDIIVNKAIAKDIKDIFEALYEAQFPIEAIRIVDEYEGDDNASMVANNTSAFNYRVVAGTDHLSNHSYGLAIDINPLVNPYVTSEGIFPPEGNPYADRTIDMKGMIKKDDVCYKAFVSRGFSWGGDWIHSKDYQHFDIKVSGINN